MSKNPVIEKSVRLSIVFGILSVLILSFSCSSLQENKPDYIKGFIKFYGGPYDDAGFDLKQTADGGFVVVGSSESYGNVPGQSDVVLIKTNAEGNEQWVQTYGSTSQDKGESIIIVDDSYIITGAYGIDEDLTGVFLLKVNKTSGEVVWQKNHLQTGFNESGKNLLQTSDGNFLVIGNTSNVYLKAGLNSSDDQSDIMVCKFDQSGTNVWNGVRGYGYKNADYGISALELKSGSNKYYAILGTSEEPASGNRNTDFYLIITTDQGILLNPQPFGTEGFDDAKGMVSTSDGGLMLIGSRRFTQNSNSELYIIKLNIDYSESTPALSQQWSKSSQDYQIRYSIEGVSVKSLEDGGYIVLSTIEKIESGKDIHLMKINSKGERIWEKTFGGSGDEVASNLIVTSDGGFAIIGTSSVERNPSMICLIKTDANGEIFP